VSQVRIFRVTVTQNGIKLSQAHKNTKKLSNHQHSTREGLRSSKPDTNPNPKPHHKVGGSSGSGVPARTRDRPGNHHRNHSTIKLGFLFRVPVLKAARVAITNEVNRAEAGWLPFHKSSNHLPFSCNQISY
jgi:hypothetical protein